MMVTRRVEASSTVILEARKEKIRETWDECKRRAKETGQTQPMILARTEDLASVATFFKGLKRQEIPCLTSWT